jgi:hypothetical protein
MSWIIAPSTGAITTAPARISRLHLPEKIFSAIVAPMLNR